MRVLNIFTTVLAIFASGAVAAPHAVPAADLVARGGKPTTNVNPHQPFAAKFGSSGNNYPIVMIHGLLGWGEAPLLGFLKYWGGVTSDLVGLLRKNGYTVYQPHVGPLSSNWERACELYAQLAGTVVDYGVARAKKMGHDRFGEDFRGKGLYPDFAINPAAKIHLIGHSMGGPTGRMFIHLMSHGFPEEVQASIAAGTTASPLFWTNRTSSQVDGFISISGVLGGTTFTDYLRAHNGLANFVVTFAELLVGVGKVIPNMYDFQLGHWKLTQNAGEGFVAYINRLFASKWGSAPSNALFDLSVQGTNDPLLNWVRNSPDTYYFSLSGLTTFNVGNSAVGEPTTLPFLVPTASIVGTYLNSSLHLAGGDVAWHPNDGLVPVLSSRADSSGYNSYVVDMTKSTQTVANSVSVAPKKGTFNWLGQLDNHDHLAIVAMLDVIGGQMNQVYMNFAGLLASLPA
ncbi:hypothetical protein HK101_009361 [Irineochytrium annulatum]|nr:hypothetical protein HK101_009361 [Irineochytrium annulatum]